MINMNRHVGEFEPIHFFRKPSEFISVTESIEHVEEKIRGFWAIESFGWCTSVVCNVLSSCAVLNQKIGRQMHHDHIKLRKS